MPSLSHEPAKRSQRQVIGKVQIRNFWSASQRFSGGSSSRLNQWRIVLVDTPSLVCQGGFSGDRFSRSARHSHNPASQDKQ
jgi:hypothetical protein